MQIAIDDNAKTAGDVMNKQEQLETELNSPDRSVLALRVGVVGHRHDRLPKSREDLEALQLKLFEILDQIKITLTAFKTEVDQNQKLGFYNNDTPVLSAITPLAEGTDRLFAQAAIDSGYRLICPLPFPEVEYQHDFEEPESLKAFQYFIKQARTNGAVFSLDGRRDGKGYDGRTAYGDAGAFVVNQSDLLIAVWDGDRAADKAGGTFETITLALNFQVPVLWIKAVAPYGWRLLRSVEDFNDLTVSSNASELASFEFDPQKLIDVIDTQVRLEITLPGDDELERGDSEEKPEIAETASQNYLHAKSYFEERAKILNLNIGWKTFRSLIGESRFKIPDIFTPRYLAGAEETWLKKSQNPAMLSCAQQIVRHFTFADRQADYYADAHRSSVLSTSFLAFAAVFLSVLLFACDWLPQVLPLASTVKDSEQIWRLVIGIAEAVDLVTLLALIYREKTSRWHDRWLEYRMLAEWLRQLRLLTPLGGGRPTPHTPPHQVVYGRPTHSWMYWHLRAVIRGLLPPTVEINKQFKLAYVDELKAETSLEGQGGFHDTNYKRYSKIEEQLKKMTESLVFISMASVLLHIGILIIEIYILPTIEHRGENHSEHLLANISSFTLLFTAGGPALVAALANINNQGEYARLSKRSLAMRSWMAQCHRQAEELNKRVEAEQPAADLHELSHLAQQITDSMVQEVSDWRVVIQDRPQAPS